MLFSDEPAGESAGDPTGVPVGGAGGEAASGDGASDIGDGLGDKDGVGEGEETGSGAGAGDGDLPNSSEGSKTLSTVKMATGGESKTASATLDGPTPVCSVIESPAVVTVRSYFPAPLVANVLIGSFVVFNVPLGL